MIDKIRLWGGGKYVYCDTLMIDFKGESKAIVRYENADFKGEVFLGSYEIEECLYLKKRNVESDVYENDIIMIGGYRFDDQFNFDFTKPLLVGKRHGTILFKQGSIASSFRAIPCKSIKVIGNIRQNPELLEAK